MEPAFLRLELEDHYGGEISLVSFTDLKEALNLAGYHLYPKDRVIDAHDEIIVSEEVLMQDAGFREHLQWHHGSNIGRLMVSKGAIVITERLHPDHLYQYSPQRISRAEVRVILPKPEDTK